MSLQITFIYNNMRFTNVNVDTEEGQALLETNNIPLEVLQQATIDALGQIISQKLAEFFASTKRDAATSKAIVLLTKVINTLNPDLSSLTQKEQDAFNKMLQLANLGYSDSDLLNASIDTLLTLLNWYAQQIQTITSFVFIEQIIDYLKNFNAPSLEELATQSSDDNNTEG